MELPLSRRDALKAGACTVLGTAFTESSSGAAEPEPTSVKPFLTPAKDFTDVSRGTPLPYKLMGEDLVKARLTVESWRLEITADAPATLEKPRKVDDGTALDFQALVKLGETKAVRYLKAMQCNNIAAPLGQGLWEGVLLRDVLALCGAQTNARRLNYWGFHNNDPKQIFRSTLAMNQVLDTPPGEMPPFLAYKLNGEPISLERGGPVRMVVPWAHGFKSVKWMQSIVLTNAYAAADTYAEKNNDPESYLKTAAYFDSTKEVTLPAGKPAKIRGTAMVGWPGLERIEYWLRAVAEGEKPLADNDPAWAKAEWQPGSIDPPPDSWGGEGEIPKDVWGFTKAGRPKAWPMRFSVAPWTITLKDLKPGKYELRVRTVDGNGFAQPEPRPNPKSGRNAIPVKRITVA